MCVCVCVCVCVCTYGELLAGGQEAQDTKPDPGALLILVQ